MKTAGALGQLAVVAGGMYVAYRAYQGIAGMPSVTETANKVWWKTSLGDVTQGVVKTSTWGDSWEYNGPSATLDDVQEHFNNGGFSTL